MPRSKYNLHRRVREFSTEAARTYKNKQPDKDQRKAGPYGWTENAGA